MGDPPGLIRPYRPGDREACLAVFDSNVPTYFGIHERPEFGAFLDDLPGPYLVLEDAGGGVGGCGGWAIRDDGVTADLCWGMLRHDLHGRGWGRTLAEARIGGIDDEGGATRIELQTSQHTRGFYERLGFEARTVEPDGFGPGIDRIVMVREALDDDAGVRKPGS